MTPVTDTAIDIFSGLPAADLDALRRAAAPFAETGAHGPDHSERVLRNALVLGRELGANPRILAAAALLHDIGRPEESASRGAICHAKRGAELARPILRDLGYDEAEITAISAAIATHRFRRGKGPETLEARILFDADKLDAIGAVGIGRAFLFAGQVGAKLHNPEADPSATSPYSSEDTAFREFQVKLSRIKDKLLTEPGRRLARERHAFMLHFFTRLTRECEGVITEDAP